MTALRDIFKRQIAQTGPLSLTEFMAECLLHPKHGYYTTRDPLGAIRQCGSKDAFLAAQS